MTGDSWLEALQARQRRPCGLYTAIAIARWRLAAEMALRLSPAGIVLKTDAWNEALDDAASILAGTRPDRRYALMDVSTGILLLAHGHHLRICGDVRAIPLASRSVSALLDISTSDHCAFDDFRTVVGSYARVLAPGGILLLIHNSSASLTWQLFRYFGRTSPAYSGFPPAFYFSPTEVIAELERQGLTVIGRHYTNGLSWLGNALDHLPPLPRAITTTLASFELTHRIPLGSLIARQHVIYARRSR